MSEFTPPKDLTEVGERMLDILDARGWSQRIIEDGDGKVCLYGALGLAMQNDANFGSYEYECSPLAREATDRLEDEAKKSFAGALHAAPWFASVNFNNSRNTTLEDVKLLIKRALFS